jgi:hypothetical protein
MKRRILLAAAAVGATCLGLGLPANAAMATSVNPKGCTSDVIYAQGTGVWGYAKCTTAAPGYYFRVVVSCRELLPNGTYSWSNAYGPWEWQGATAQSWATCSRGDVMGARAEVSS